MVLSRPTVLTHNPREEEAVVVVYGSTATSSKDSERSLLMAAHLQKILRLIIITGVAEQADVLLSTSRRTIHSPTSGGYIQIHTNTIIVSLAAFLNTP